MKKKFAWILGALALVIALGLLKNVLAERAVVLTLRGVLGAPVAARGVSLSLLKGELEVKGLRVGQPKGFPRGIFVDAPSVAVEFDAGSFLSGRPRLRRVAVEVDEIILVRDKEGRLNADALRVSREAASSGPEKPAPAGKGVRIDLLELSLGRVVSKDLSKPKLYTEVFNVKIERARFEGITGAEEIVSVILVQTLRSAAVKGAAIYGASAATGVGLIPVGAALLLAAGGAEAEVAGTFKHAWRASLDAVKDMGEVIETDSDTGWIRADVHGADVRVDLAKRGKKTLISVSAKKFMIPNGRLAGGVLYEILDRVR